MRQIKCPHCGKKTTDAELASYSGRCVHCRYIATPEVTASSEKELKPSTDIVESHQLVGLHCVRCQQSIDSIGEGQFCDNCGNPAHNKCTNPSNASSVQGERCTFCGGDPESPIAKTIRWDRAEPQRRKQAEEIKAVQNAEQWGRSKQIGYKGFRRICLLIMGIGLIMIFPNLRREGRFMVNFDNLVAGFGVIFAGAVLIALTYILQRQKK